MIDKPIIAILNLKHGVGCSNLTWNLAHILDLDIYQHDKALHKHYLEQREYFIKEKVLLNNRSISVYDINKRKFQSGIYDLGADFNFPYVKTLLKKSDVIIVPIENSNEVLLKSIATLKYIIENASLGDKKIFVVFNRLDNSENISREKNYTSVSKDMILDFIPDDKVKFFYLRYSFALLKNQENGYFFLDNFLNENVKIDKEISYYDLLQHVRYYTINKMYHSKQKNKAIQEKKSTEFFKTHKMKYEDFIEKNSVKNIFDLKYIEKNKKVIKDMLILSTHIKDTYTKR